MRRDTITLDARRLYQPMEPDRKYSVHAQTDHDCCCCRPKIMAPRDCQTQNDTSQIRYNGGHLLGRAYGQIGSIGRSRHASKRATREEPWVWCESPRPGLSEGEAGSLVRPKRQSSR
jgi:hypothetical protein